MTKLRAPLSYELALSTIIGALGYERVAELTGQAPRTVHSWSEPDAGRAAGDAINLNLAERLDAAYRAAGGEGSPLLQCLATRLDAAALVDVAGGLEITRSAAKAAKEHGDAIAATLAAAEPGASDAQRARAELELEEAIAAHTNTLATVRAGRNSDVQQPLGGEN